MSKSTRDQYVMAPASPASPAQARIGPPLDLSDEPDEVQKVVRGLGPWAIAVLVHGSIVALGLMTVGISLRNSAAAKDEDFDSFVTIIGQPNGTGLVVADKYQLTKNGGGDSAALRPKSLSPVGSPFKAPLGLGGGKEGTGKSKGPSFSASMVIGTGPGGGGSNGSPFKGDNGNGGTGDGTFVTLAPPRGARTFAFVIDASGSMLDTFPLVANELKKTIRSLTDYHSFTVIFFQGDRAIEPLEHGLKAASDENKRRLFDWLDDSGLAPMGLSQPLPAIATGLKYKPQVLFLLSDDITGRGRYEVDQMLLLRQIETANVGRTRINALQFLYPDPLERAGLTGTMKLIAKRSGGEYKFISAADLGLVSPAAVEAASR